MYPLQLIVFGVQISNVHELELIPANQKLGLHVTLTRADGEVVTCHNCTEFHFLHGGRPTTDTLNTHVFACESDIHGEGYSPWDIYTKFTKIEVTEAHALNYKF